MTFLSAALLLAATTAAAQPAGTASGMTAPEAAPAPAAAPADAPVRFPEQLYRLALENDPVYAAAVSQAQAGLEAYRIRRGSILPQITASANARYIETENESEFFGSFDEEYMAHGYGAQLRQPVFRWDILATLELGRIEVLAAQVRLRRTRQELVGRLTDAYFDVLAAQDALETSRATLRAVERNREQIKDRFEVGAIAVTGLREADARADLARARVIEAELAVQNARDALAEIVGTDDFALTPLKGKHSDLPLKYPALGSWLEQAMTRNSGVVAATLQYRVAEQNIAAAKSRLLPQVDAVAGIDYQDTAESRVGQESTQKSVGLELTVPIWSGGARRAEARAARATYLQRAEELRAAQVRAQTEVRTAFRAVRTADRRVDALRAAASSSQIALAAVRDGYQVGTRTIADVLDAEQAALEAEQALAAERYRYLRAMIDLELAAGTVTEDDWDRLQAAILGTANTPQPIPGTDTQPVLIPAPAS